MRMRSPFLNKRVGSMRTARPLMSRMKIVKPRAIDSVREGKEFLLALAVVAAPLFTFFAVLAFFALTDDEELFVLRGGQRCRRAGAFAFVVFGRVLRNAPRTSSSCWALAINKTQPTITAANGTINSFDFISLPLERYQKPERQGGPGRLTSPL